MAVTTNYDILRTNLREIRRPDIKLSGNVIRLLESNEIFLYIIYMLTHGNIDENDNNIITNAKYQALLADIDTYKKKFNFTYPEIQAFLTRECHTD
jgi:hypothetical protein